MKAKQHVPFMDCAYQGFASGNADLDAAAIRLFVEDGHTMMVAQSYAKNFGLYGERIGCLSMVCPTAEEADSVLSQLKIIIRASYSNPPIHGAHIVRTILSDPALEKQWYGECKAMADRIIDMRTALVDALSAAGNSASGPSAARSLAGGCLRGGAETGACVWSMVFGGCAVCVARATFKRR